MECVLCDWVFDPFAAPLAVYRPGGRFPLRWTPEGITEVHLTDLVAETAPSVALVYHWHEAHRLQLFQIFGDYDVDLWPRSH